jgi:hypothetical protein
MKLIDLVFQALEGRTFRLSELPAFSLSENTPDDYVLLNSLNRISFAQESRLSDLLITRQVFRARINDYAALRDFDKISTSLSFQGTFTVTLS